MSRMFSAPDGQPMKTWNVFKGCFFECTYCSAKKLALTRLKNSPRYRDGFAPRLIVKELKRSFRPGEFIFVAYMGDIAYAGADVARLILERVARFPETSFLFCTKAPLCYVHWPVEWPDNVYFGVTIESTEDWEVSNAPAPAKRAEVMKRQAMDGRKKFVSIEPVMDFRLDLMLEWMACISPEIIEVGADNYGNGLKEPPPDKVVQLLQELRQICPNVIEKKGLNRLLKEK